MIRSAIIYANIRAQWSVRTLEERRNIDKSRTHQHMINLNVIATYMKQQDMSLEWFDKLGTIDKDR